MKQAALVLALLLALPAFAGIGSDITLPVAGRLELTGRIYNTEITLTNHRDVAQRVAVVLFVDGESRQVSSFILDPHQTLFRPRDSSNWVPRGIGAVRFIGQVVDAIGITPDPEQFRDPAARLEAKALILHERGPFGLYGSSRQEVESIPSEEYRVPQTTFAAVLHQPPTYTNVGIVNMHPTDTVTFYVQYQFLEPVPVTVPPLSSVQIRVTGDRGVPTEEGNGGRFVTVTPEWADDPSGRTTPWVAYASTVDGYTGDAFSGMRVPPNTRVR
jgi:hypothetical protein